MNNFEKLNIEDLVLNDYSGIRVRADIEEAPEDIIAMVLYDDHGDDFLVVKTTNGTYEYGWFLSRPGYPNYNELDFEWNKSRFLRKPKLDGKYDYKFYVGNDLIWDTERVMYKAGCYSRALEPETKEQAQFEFDRAISIAKATYDYSGVIYHNNTLYQDAAWFIKEYGIDTEENLEKLEQYKTYLRMGAIDGSAGKKDLSNRSCVVGDNIKWIFYRGEVISKSFNKHGIKVKGSMDREWGVRTFILDLDQFKED